MLGTLSDRHVDFRSRTARTGDADFLWRDLDYTTFYCDVTNSIYRRYVSEAFSIVPAREDKELDIPILIHSTGAVAEYQLRCHMASLTIPSASGRSYTKASEPSLSISLGVSLIHCFLA